MAFTVAVQVAFNSGRIVAFVYPMLALALGTLGTLLSLLDETIERERVHDLFSRFVPAESSTRSWRAPTRTCDSAPTNATAPCCSPTCAGSRASPRNSPPRRVIEVVNCYLNEMTEAILDAGGTLIAYMGDGIMAVFGAPLEQDDHADRALAAATEMVGPRLARSTRGSPSNGHDHRFVMGVGSTAAR